VEYKKHQAEFGEKSCYDKFTG